MLRLEDEWYEDVCDPLKLVGELKKNRKIKPDLFTFWQRLPKVAPEYSFHCEYEDIAALPITTHAAWFSGQIKSRVRNLIRKSEKEGVEVRESVYDDDFVHGMTRIFNEAPIRQGRKFWHYGKDFETIKMQFSRFVKRERMIAAYYRGEMIGLIMLGDAGSFAITGQIISSLHHRDKATNNLLVSKAVQVCEEQGFRHLCYLNWSEDSLSEFKRRCGFEKIGMPRYYVPLTAKGKIWLRLGLHRGLKSLLPSNVRNALKAARTRWLEMKGRSQAGE